MAKVRYLISFPGSAMDVSAEDLPEVAEAAHGVIDEARAAGVYIFGGGLNEDIETVMVDGDGSVTRGTYPQTTDFSGGFTVIEVPTRQEALEWAAKIAMACRCPQEVREFQFDPRS